MQRESRECCFRTDGLPFSKAVWEMTFVCSLKCPYCFQERTGHRDDLSRSELRAVRQMVYEFLAAMRPSHVLLSGGEPLVLGDELCEAIERVKDLGATFSVSTTGFPRKTFLRVLDYGPSGVNISIDPAGMSGQQYEYRKTKFEVLKSTLRQVGERGIPIKGTSLITKDNLENVPAYAQMLRDLVKDVPTLRTVFVANPYHIGYTRPDLSVPPAQVREFVDAIGGLDDLPIEMRFVNFSAISMPLQECPAAQGVFCIVPNGDVVGCPFLYQRTRSFAIGNVAENAPCEIRDALQRFASVISQNVDQLLRLTPECEHCEARSECRGGCFAETFAMKETSIPSLLCERTVTRAKDRNGTLVSLPLRVRANLMAGGPKTHFKKRMLPKDVEDKIAMHVRQYMERTFSDIAHRYDHIQCVVRLAKRICEQEGANARIVVPAAYFHDFAPRQHQAFHFHTDESADAAAAFLADNGFDEDEITGIVHCIVASEFSSFLLGIEPKTIEARVVRDADWLESIGARGIARAFSFAGKHCAQIGSVDYDPRKPRVVRHNIMAPDETPLQHFAAKLLLIRDLLLTETGQRLGAERHAFMVEFLSRLREEEEAAS